MDTLKQQFIQLAIDNGVIRFGEFRLKSGRISPYFFNMGAFTTGGALAKLGFYYTQTIVEAALPFDMLFGLAYKGIPLVTSTAIFLNEKHGKNIPYAFNRKEIKDHGEGGNIVGAPLGGRVLVIDDVITAGTAVRESIALIKEAHATIAGIVVALDRQEKGLGNLSAIQEVSETYQVPVLSIIRLQDLLAYLKNTKEFKSHYQKVAAYQQQYGVTF